MVRRLTAAVLLVFPLVSLSAHARDKEDLKPLDPQSHSYEDGEGGPADR